MESGSPSRGLSVPRLRISKGLQETPGKLGVWIGLSKRYTRCRRLSSSAQNWPRPSRCPGLRVLTLEPPRLTVPARGQLHVGGSPDPSSAVGAGSRARPARPAGRPAADPDAGGQSRGSGRGVPRGCTGCGALAPGVQGAAGAQGAGLAPRVRGAAGVHGCGAGSRGAGRRGPRWRLAGAGARSVRPARSAARCAAPARTPRSRVEPLWPRRFP